MLALALASGLAVSAAAEQVGVDRKTVQRRLADPDFRRQVADLRAEAVAAALGRLTESMTRAADAAAALLDAPEPHIRLRASRTILSLALRIRDSVDTTERLRECEAVLARKMGMAG